MPDAGDRVSAEFVGEWTATGKLKLPDGTEVSTTGATLRVLTHAVRLYPGQVWRRNADELLFTISQEATGRVASPANRTVQEVPVPEQSFNRTNFTLMFDPREV